MDITKNKLFVKGFLYIKSFSNNEAVCWECSQKNEFMCIGCVFTDLQARKLLSMTDHNHVSDIVTIDEPFEQDKIDIKEEPLPIEEEAVPCIEASCLLDEFPAATHAELSETSQDQTFELTVDQGGLLKLSVGEFLYNKVFTNSKRTYWECTYKELLSCKGCANTDPENNKLISVSQHSHQPVSVKMKTSMDSLNSANSGEIVQLPTDEILNVKTSEKEGANEPEPGCQLEIIKNYRGGIKLCADGYLYTRKSYTSKKIRWECSQRYSLSCRGTARSDSSITKLISVRQHSHKPDPSRVRAVQIKNAINIAALENSESPADILSDILGQQPPEVCGALGSVEDLKRNVRRLRKDRMDKIVQNSNDYLQLSIEEYSKGSYDPKIGLGDSQFENDLSTNSSPNH